MPTKPKTGVGGKDLHYDKVQRAIRKYHGLQEEIAKELGTTRRVIGRYLENNPTLKEEAQQERQGVMDLLESRAWKLALGIPNPEAEEHDKNQWIVAPDPKMLQFLLKTIGQDRGYYDGPQFQQGNANQVINITIGGSLAEADKTLENSLEVEAESVEVVQEIEGGE